MMRNARHAKILEIIAEKEIETQEELCAELAAENFTVAQATVSRDIKELHLFKVRGNQRRFRYASITETEGGISEKMRTLLRDCVETIRIAGNLIVIKTLVGNGGNAGATIDKLNYREVVGSIAGVDSLLVICESAAEANTVRSKLEALIKV